MPIVPVDPKKNPFPSVLFRNVTWTIGAKAGSTIRVTMNLLSPHYKAAARVTPVRVLLSDAATGVGLCAVAPSGTVVAPAGLGTVLYSPVSKTFNVCQTNASGVLALDITEAGTKSLYVAVELPNGGYAVSTVVQF